MSEKLFDKKIKTFWNNFWKTCQLILTRIEQIIVTENQSTTKKSVKIDLDIFSFYVKIIFLLPKLSIVFVFTIFTNNQFLCFTILPNLYKCLT
jgi:hypothetical protein